MPTPYSVTTIAITPEQVAMYTSAAKNSGLSRHGWIVAVLGGQARVKRADRATIVAVDASDSEASARLSIQTASAEFRDHVWAEAERLGLPVAVWCRHMLDTAAGRLGLMRALEQAHDMAGR